MQINPGPHDRRRFIAVAMTAGVGLLLRPTVALSQDVMGLTLKKASGLLRTRAASSLELTQAFLRRIEDYNPTLNALITVTAEQALTTARELDSELQRGKGRGPLHGIPITVKDNIDTGGIRTTAASELFKDRIPSEDAEVVRRLKKAGAVLLGKPTFTNSPTVEAPRSATSAPCITRGLSIVFRADRLVVQLPRPHPTCALPRWEPTPRGRFEFQQRTAGSSD